MNTRGFAWLAAVALVPLVGCGDDATGPEALCLAVVNVEGVIFAEVAGGPVAPELVSSEPVLTVTRNTGCLDMGQPSEPLASGESNYLEVGTTLHAIEGFDPTERLAVYSELIDEWTPIGPTEAGSAFN